MSAPAQKPRRRMIPGLFLFLLLFLLPVVLIISGLMVWHVISPSQGNSTGSGNSGNPVLAETAQDEDRATTIPGDGLFGTTQTAPYPQSSIDQFPSDGLSPGQITCPVTFPTGCGAIDYSQKPTVETWRARSDQGCQESARELLYALQADGFELVKAGYLDLFGEAWGCAVKGKDDRSYVISLLPERLGYPRGDENKLNITVVRIGIPEIAIAEDSEQ